jgi:hypothetical protein
MRELITLVIASAALAMVFYTAPGFSEPLTPEDFAAVVPAR